MIYYGCPKCQAAMASPDGMAGETETCPRCGNVAVVPQAGPVVEAPAKRQKARQGKTRTVSGLLIPRPGADMKQCPKCKEWIAKAATKCPRCQSAQPQPAWAVILATVIVVVIGVWVFRSC